MSEWNHNICDQCYAEKFPGEEPRRIIASKPEICCVCGRENLSGILIRLKPSNPILICNGVHANAEARSV